MSVKIEIRPIKHEDNAKIASIIQNTLIEFDGNKPGTAFSDKSTTNMFAAYQDKNEIYYVAILNDAIVGGCGINKLDGGSSQVCELQKMYISSKARGLKIGRKLLNKCIDFATKVGYKQCYLETFPHMYAAIKLYKQNNFYTINKAMGKTGHTVCDVWMLKNLNE